MKENKLKIIFVGITMNCAGSEKSFLSFISSIDLSKYDCTLLLAKKTGLFLDMLPKELRVLELEKYGDHFLQSGQNAKENIFNTFIKRNPLTAFTVYPYYDKIKKSASKEETASLATKLWIKLMDYIPPLKEKYDVAVAYWGDRTMFFALDKISADRYITWMHFDYAHPKRDDSIYLPYFKRCEAIVNVSTAVDDALKASLPEIAEKCVVMENIQCASLIKQLSKESAEFPDADYRGKRIVTVARISFQKGLDLAIRALARLRAGGTEARWYIVGGSDESYEKDLRSLIREYGVEDSFFFLGAKSNPYPYIAGADVYAQPSRFEGKPISVEEAKILARPIVVCDYLSAKEQLSDGEYGIVSDFDEESLAEALERALYGDFDRFIKILSARSFSNESEVGKFYRIVDGGRNV